MSEEIIAPRDAWRKLNTRLLVIQTVHPETVKELLVRFDLAQLTWFEEHREGYVYVCYPEDKLSISLMFWLGAAQTCGLIERWIQ